MQIPAFAIPMNCYAFRGDQRKDVLDDPDAQSWVPNRPMSSGKTIRDENGVNGTKITFPARQHCKGTGNASVLFQLPKPESIVCSVVPQMLGLPVFENGLFTDCCWKRSLSQ